VIESLLPQMAHDQLHFGLRFQLYLRFLASTLPAVRWNHQGGVEVGGGVARIGGVCVRRFSVPWGKARLIIHLKAIPLSENQLR